MVIVVNVTGQCIGIRVDKLSLWSHPQEIRVALRDGGWTAESIAKAWETSVSPVTQSIG
jgi:hypothetical protein